MRNPATWNRNPVQANMYPFLTEVYFCNYLQRRMSCLPLIPN
jgi:hypothetical protein